MNLSEHFTLEELTFSATAQRLLIDNTPPLDIVANLSRAAIGMEKVRELLGDKPIHVDSGYRCPALNRAVGGAANSSHMDGYAVDFICPDFGTPLQIVQAIKDSLQFDQLIVECNRWVHISFDPRMRGQVLTASVKDGVMTYSEGS